MKYLYWILHLFTGCPDKHIEYIKPGLTGCEKCKRMYFNFEKWGE